MQKQKSKLRFIDCYVCAWLVILLVNATVFVAIKCKNQQRKVEPYSHEALKEEDYMEEILLLREDLFKLLSDKRKTEVLEKLVYVESYKAGIKAQRPKVVICNMTNATGQYSSHKNVIRINKEFFKSASSRELVNVCLHEWHHWYSHQLSEAYLSLPKKYQDMDAFAQFRVYAYEYQNYVTAEKDLDGYYYQSVESDARNYAELETQGIFKFIENYYSDMENE